MYKIIVDQVVYVKGQAYRLGDLLDVSGVAADQLLRSGKIAPVEEEAVAAPADPEPVQDVPKKAGKAVRGFQKK